MKNSALESIAQRKAQLVAEGAAYRSGIGDATQAVKEGLRAQSLARNALGYFATIGFSLLKGRTGVAGLGLQTALPLLMSGVAALNKKPRLKFLLRSGLIAGTVGTLASIILKKKKAAVAAQER
jgi:hypothetical protein